MYEVPVLILADILMRHDADRDLVFLVPLTCLGKPRVRHLRLYFANAVRRCVMLARLRDRLASTK